MKIPLESDHTIVTRRRDGLIYCWQCGPGLHDWSEISNVPADQMIQIIPRLSQVDPDTFPFRGLTKEDDLREQERRANWRARKKEEEAAQLDVRGRVPDRSPRNAG